MTASVAQRKEDSVERSRIGEFVTLMRGCLLAGKIQPHSCLYRVFEMSRRGVQEFRKRHAVVLSRRLLTVLALLAVASAGILHQALTTPLLASAARAPAAQSSSRIERVHTNPMSLKDLIAGADRIVEGRVASTPSIRRSPPPKGDYVVVSLAVDQVIHYSWQPTSHNKEIVLEILQPIPTAIRENDRVVWFLSSPDPIDRTVSFVGFDSGYFKVSEDTKTHRKFIENLHHNRSLWSNTDLWTIAPRVEVQKRLLEFLRPSKLSPDTVRQVMQYGDSASAGPVPLDLVMTVARTAAHSIPARR
jgi:hypothetical protein